MMAITYFYLSTDNVTLGFNGRINIYVWKDLLYPGNIVTPCEAGNQIGDGHEFM